ncbi:MAG: hypothetical protein Q8P73_03680 [bacterium]|nr:hypothetical protein [bacterium]
MTKLVKLAGGISAIASMALVVAPVYASGSDSSSWGWFSTASSSGSSASIQQTQQVESPLAVDPVLRQQGTINLHSIAGDTAISDNQTAGMQEMFASGTFLGQSQTLSADSYATADVPPENAGETPWWIEPPAWWTDGPTINTNVDVAVTNNNPSTATATATTPVSTTSYTPFSWFPWLWW